MSSGGWHPVNSASGSHHDSGAAAAAAAEDEASAGGYNPDYDAFLAEEAALPVGTHTHSRQWADGWMGDARAGQKREAA